ncbi:MAG: right-handed parallel beta-helix repeat-containing protein [Planctomycetota bacterium]
MRRLILTALCVVALGATAFGATLRVPKDYETIQDAVDAAENGDVIVVKKGTYHESVEIALREDVTLKAAGKVVIDGGNTLDGLQIGLVENVTVTGFTILNAVGPGVRIVGTDGVTVSKCRVEGSGGAGVVIESCRNLRIDRCRIESTVGQGVLVAEGTGNPASMNCAVTRCRMRETGQTAIQFQTGEAHLAEKNRLEGGEIYTILVRAPRSVCRKNRISGSENTSVMVDVDEVTVEKNRIDTAGAHGIFVLGGDCIVAKNRVKEAAEAGIRLQGTGNRAEKNRVGACGFGFQVYGSGNEIVGNRAKQCLTAVDDFTPQANLYEKNNFDPPPAMPI